MPDESSFSSKGETPVSARSEPRRSTKSTATPSQHERAFYGATEPPLLPESYDELAEIAAQAQDQNRKIIPSGIGSHAYLGVPPASEPLIVSLRKLDQVVRYEPDDFTVGVQAGTRLSTLRDVLAKNRQEIPVDVSSRSESTLGGWLAANPPGPRQIRSGLLRNYLIGLHGLRGGRPPQKFKSGGMVVKNVAGYEAGKFLLGSLGTAGFIVEANFKLRPLPSHRSLSVALFGTRRGAWTFVRAFRDLQIEPAMLQVLGGEAGTVLQEKLEMIDPQAHTVLWQFEGNESLVAWQKREIEKLLAEYSSASTHEISVEAIPGVTDFICEFPEPPATLAADLAILRLGEFPSGLREFETVLFGTLDSEDIRFSATLDALSGLLTLRLHAPEETVASVLSRIRELVHSRNATGTLLYLPPGQRAAYPYYHFVPNPTAKLIGDVRRVFDPENLFLSDRVLGRE